MAMDDVCALHDQAWKQLSDLVQERSRLLRSLAQMATIAAEITPATGMMVEFDIEKARPLLDQVEDLTPQIAAGIVQVNRHARGIGKPQIRWFKIEAEND